MKSFFFVFLCLGIFLSAHPLRAESPVWLDNYPAALKQAKSEHKPILLLFTGGSWCGVCILAEQNLFQTPQFADYARKNLVLLKVTFSSLSDILVLRSHADQEPYVNEGPAGTHAAAQTAMDQKNEEFNRNGKSPGQKLFLKYCDSNHGVPTVVLLSERGARISEINTNIIAVQAPVADYLASIDQEIKKRVGTNAPTAKVGVD